jgi:hypothetical protein
MKSRMSSVLDGDGDVPAGASVAARAEGRLMGRVLAGLFCAGATLALLTVVLPDSARANDLGLLVIVGIAYAVAGLLFNGADNLGSWVPRAALAWGSTLITGVAYFSGEAPSPLIFFYLWVFLYSTYSSPGVRLPFRFSTWGSSTARC